MRCRISRDTKCHFLLVRSGTKMFYFLPTMSNDHGYNHISSWLVYGHSWIVLYQPSCHFLIRTPQNGSSAVPDIYIVDPTIQLSNTPSTFLNPIKGVNFLVSYLWPTNFLARNHLLDALELPWKFGGNRLSCSRVMSWRTDTQSTLYTPWAIKNVPLCFAP